MCCRVLVLVLVVGVVVVVVVAVVAVVAVVVAVVVVVVAVLVVVVVVVVVAVVVVAVAVVVPGQILGVKNCVFSGDFAVLEEETLVFTMFLLDQGQNSSKTLLVTLISCEWVYNTFFCIFSWTGGSKCIVNTGVFFISLLPALKENQPKTQLYTVAF